MSYRTRLVIIGGVILLLLLAVRGPDSALANDAPADLVCRDLLQNGEFEATTGWRMTPLRQFAGPVSDRVRDGKQAMRVGVVQGENIRNYATIWQQVEIPEHAVRAVLDIWVFPTSDETSGGADRQEVRILDSHYRTLLSPLRGLQQGNEWQQVTIDLARFRGETVRIYVNVFNDGQGGRTALYVDSIHLTACQPRTMATEGAGNAETTVSPVPNPVVLTPSPTATPAVPPPPTGSCGDLVQNGGFEEGTAGWVFGKTPKPAAVSGAQVHSGQNAVRLGSMADADARSYSSVWQTLSLPSDVLTATLSFWASRLTDDTDGGDSQVALVLDDGYRIRQRPLHSVVQEEEWVRIEKDLTAYAGWTLRLYFNVFNDGDGNATALYVDDVEVEVCR